MHLKQQASQSHSAHRPSTRAHQGLPVEPVTDPMWSLLTFARLLSTTFQFQESWESWHTVLKVRHWILPCINPFSTTHLSESVGNMRCACHWMCLTHSNKNGEILQIHWSLRRATVEAEVPASSALEPRQRSLQTPIKYRCFWIFDKGCKETWETPITCCNIWEWASFKNDIPRETNDIWKCLPNFLHQVASLRSSGKESYKEYLQPWRLCRSLCASPWRQSKQIKEANNKQKGAQERHGKTTDITLRQIMHCTSF